MAYKLLIKENMYNSFNTISVKPTRRYLLVCNFNRETDVVSGNVSIFCHQQAIRHAKFLGALSNFKIIIAVIYNHNLDSS